jgi:Ca2+-binding RTX toxin-like protein
MANFFGFDLANENFVGTSSADKFTPQSSAALGVIDTVDGAGGVDLLILDFSSEIDSVNTAISPTGQITYFTTGLFTGSPFRNAITATNIERFNIIGTNFLDDIVGGAGSDILRGGAGDDFIRGENGDDIIYGDDGFDKINGGDGSDQIFGGAGNDFLNGGSGRDTLTGGFGNDVYIVDRTSDNIVELAGEGADTVQSSTNYSLADSANNVETLILIEGSAAANGFGNSLDNRIIGNSSNNRIDGAEGVDTLLGMDGNDYLVGGVGNFRDFIEGGNGDDILEGGGGFDKLTGGTGRDAFRYVSSADSGTDTITDFSVADDIIQISKSGYSLSLLPGALASNKFVLGSSTTNTGTTILYDSATGLVTLDANGSNVGGIIKLANVGAGLNLTHSNFRIL